jgi:hypothetical protein
VAQGDDLWVHTQSAVWDSGTFTFLRLDFTPLQFINSGSELFIIGKPSGDKGDGKLRKYRYIGKSQKPIYMHDISADEVRNSGSEVAK